MLEGLEFDGEASTRKLGGGVAMADGTDRGAELRPGCARLMAVNTGEGLGRGNQRKFQLALQASWRGQRRRRLAAVARGAGAARVAVHGAGRVGLPAWAQSRSPWAYGDFTTCAGSRATDTRRLYAGGSHVRHVDGSDRRRAHALWTPQRRRRRLFLFQQPMFKIA
jgi:hypothetical protein